MMCHNRFQCAPLVLAFCLAYVGGCVGPDALPSWEDGPTKQRIVAFVERVTDPADPAFVAPDERIAVFDNDGNLWAEKPIYTQLLFAMDRIRALAPQHPEWQSTQPFKAVLENDHAALAAGGKKALMQLVMASHAGMTTDEFESIVTDWLARAKHPRFKRPYTECVYKPMLELLTYLRNNDFKTFIVSGGGIEFMRPWAQEVYGIPPEQVVGSSIKTRFVTEGDGASLVRLPEIDFINDKAGKPVGIHKFIGRRPILASGNSDGDLQMLQYTAAGKGPRLILLLHHDDAEREYAYDRDSHVGRLDKALDEARRREWVVVSMKKDFRAVFAAGPK
jgi:haloacid dehalogenase-like hydrolase